MIDLLKKLTPKGIDTMPVTQGISIIIPTYNYKNLLKKTLDSLCLQTLDIAFYEVIVADDGSSDNSRELVENYKDRLRIKYFYQPDLGFRAAKVRNEGIKLASYENILLLDSGMIASTNLLSIHLNIHSKQTDHAVIGMSYGVNEFDNANMDKLLHILSSESTEGLFTELSRHPELNDCRYDYLAGQQFDINSSTAPWSIFWTGHVSFKKSSFDSIGGFDEWFCSWGGEDVDLGIRLYKRGCKFYLVDTIETIHHPHYKNPRDKELSSQKNIEYICNKFMCTEVGLLRKYSWLEILLKTRVDSTAKHMTQPA